MYIGHINLSASINGIGEHFVRLVEALSRQGVRQHVIVRDPDLARRLTLCDSVSAGPVVRSAVTACCLMPETNVVHAHDPKGAQAGLMLALTRSIPFVLSWRESEPPGRNPIVRSTLRRASGVVCPAAGVLETLVDIEVPGVVDVIPDISHEADDDESRQDEVAARYMRLYRRSGDSRRIPALLL